MSRSAGASPLCPQCGSKKLWRDGLRYSLFGDRIQRWLCRNCGFRFSDSDDVQRALSAFERVERVDTKAVKGRGDKALECQICVKETKNLAAEQKEVEVPRRSEVDIKGKIVEFMWRLKTEAYAEDTISGYGYVLKTLAKRGANLFNPESVKEVIARQTAWGQARKSNVIKAYACFLNKEGIQAILPKYKVARKLPFIPAEDEIDQLIAGCGHRMATFLQLLKETAARCGEAFALEWINLDIRASTVAIVPEKGSEPRVFKISSKLLTMLLTLPRTSERIFPYATKFYARKTFMKMRKRIAHNLGNPRILRIHFHTFRHWKATMEYHKTRDILHVMRLLGHKNIKNTLIYTQLISIQDDDYVCKTAKTIQEATQLIEGGFEYVTEMEGYKLFRKRK
jgi:integrase/predicted RNA-binding Zn-ribbon protein involved in translation (DUF1610 family)